MAGMYTQHQLPPKLLESSGEGLYDTVELWSATLGNEKEYNCHAFIVRLQTEAYLSLNWELYRNDIATCFQTDLSKDIEIWNIYLFFIIDGPVSRDLKYKIEQDRYSTRKVVISKSSGQYQSVFLENGIDVRILLDTCLFNVEVNQGSSQSDVGNSVKELIESLDPDILTVLEEYTPGIKKQKEFYHSYLTKKNIQNEIKGN